MGEGALVRAEPAEVIDLRRRREQREQFDQLVGSAVKRALDEREAQARAERAEGEATPESRARAWSVQALNTRTGYERDFRAFVEWAAMHGHTVGTPGELADVLQAAPGEHAAEIEAAFASATPALVVAYLLDLDEQGKAITTIGRAAAAIGAMHARFGKPKPTRSERVRDELSYLRRKQKHKPKRAKAIELDHLERMIATFEPRDTKTKLRDAAMVLVWHAFGLRRSEVAKLRREHVEIDEKRRALVLTIHESKTDQLGEGRTLVIGARDRRDLCALRAVEGWLAAAELESSSPLFPVVRGSVIYDRPMTHRALDLLVKRWAKKAKLEGNFSTHSIRAGTATALYSLGTEESAISRHLRHSSVAVTRIYDRPSNGVDRDPWKGKL